jgi:hypothetical protein
MEMYTAWSGKWRDIFTSSFSLIRFASGIEKNHTYNSFIILCIAYIYKDTEIHTVYLYLHYSIYLLVSTLVSVFFSGQVIFSLSAYMKWYTTYCIRF